MGWGKLPSENRVAAEAAEAAAERARGRMQMTPFQRQLLDVLTDIRDELRAARNQELFPGGDTSPGPAPPGNPAPSDTTNP